MSKCFNYESGKDSGGNAVMERKCYCETTGCLQQDTIEIELNTPMVCSYSGEPEPKDEEPQE